VKWYQSDAMNVQSNSKYVSRYWLSPYITMHDDQDYTMDPEKWHINHMLTADEVNEQD
jgi:hypothetical protein